MNDKLSIDKGLKLKKLPDEFGEQWPDINDLFFNLQRIMGHLMGFDENIAASTLWWSEQIIKNIDQDFEIDQEEARRQDQL